MLEYVHDILIVAAAAGISLAILYLYTLATSLSSSSSSSGGTCDSLAAVPVGTIIPFAGTLTNLPNGWIACDGAAYSPSTYPDLYDQIKYTYGQVGVNYMVPDTRGLFLRGLDNGATRDSGRAIGTTQLSTAPTIQPPPYRNKIINGACEINQRDSGAPATCRASGYTIDRWAYVSTQDGKATYQQNAGNIAPPAGFTNYLGFTTAAALTIGPSDYFTVVQYIEGTNIADLRWGSPAAVPVALSFYVYSSAKGAFGGAINNGARTRSYPFQYVIAAANSWAYITVLVPGDIAGTWATNTTTGIVVAFSLGAGTAVSGPAGTWAAATYVSAAGAAASISTVGTTFYITGIQLEAGAIATPFERIPYAATLAACLRYYEQVNNCFIVGTIGYPNDGWRGLAIAFAAKRAVPQISSNLGGFNTVWLTGAGYYKQTTVQVFLNNYAVDAEL